MRWTLTNFTEIESIIRLIAESDSHKLLQVKFTPDKLSFRIKYNDMQRLFFAEALPLPKKGFSISNEYGNELGQIRIDLLNSDVGTLTCYHTRFEFAISHKPFTYLSIQRNLSPADIIECNAESLPLDRLKTLSLVLIWGIGWVDSLPAKSNKEYFL